MSQHACRMLFSFIFWWRDNCVASYSKTISKTIIRTNICAKCVKRLHLSSLAYGIVCINKYVTYITNQVLTSKHDYMFDFDLHLPERLANCKSFIDSCSQYTPCDNFAVGPLYCTKQSHVLKES